MGEDAGRCSDEYDRARTETAKRAEHARRGPAQSTRLARPSTSPPRPHGTRAQQAGGRALV